MNSKYKNRFFGGPIAGSIRTVEGITAPLSTMLDQLKTLQADCYAQAQRKRDEAQALLDEAYALDAEGDRAGRVHESLNEVLA